LRVRAGRQQIVSGRSERAAAWRMVRAERREVAVAAEKLRKKKFSTYGQYTACQPLSYSKYSYSSFLIHTAWRRVPAARRKVTVAAEKLKIEQQKELMVKHEAFRGVTRITRLSLYDRGEGDEIRGGGGN